MSLAALLFLGVAARAKRASQEEEELVSEEDRWVVIPYRCLQVDFLFSHVFNCMSTKAKRIANIGAVILRWRPRRPQPGLIAREVEVGSTIIEMKGITKRFPGVLANDNVNLEIRKGEIHALLGENGAGKTTLMNILYGVYELEEGEIYVKGEKLVPKSPRDAIEMGIGMVHQHFTLVPPLSVTENIILGLKSSKGAFLDLDSAEERIAELSGRFGLKVAPKAKVWQLSLGEQQRVEILKALYRGADILILDEPTSVLTPQEVEGLFKTLRTMVEQGLTIIFITHKLPEVTAVSDRVTVLRGGKVMVTLETRETNKRELAKLMVGREVLFRLLKHRVEIGEVVLEVKSLWALSDRGLPALKDVSLEVREGEILGIAGVAGNGQRELAEVITGLRKAESGKVLIRGQDLTNRSPKDFIERGVAHIPEERTEMGVIMNFSLAENIILETHSDPPFANKFLLKPEEIASYTDRLIKDFDVVTTGGDAPARTLSGGNLQRLILARELSRNPKLLVANKPTRGLDVGSTEYIRRRLLEEREKGTAILLISEDLDEILSLSDHIAVMYEGRVMGTVPAAEATIEEIGLMMAGIESSTRVGGD